MRMPLWIFRLLHRQKMSRRGMRGGWLHTQLGDRVLDKSLWRPSRDSLARAWLVGFPITVVPFLPFQSLLAVAVAFMVRGNILFAVALQFLSNPFTAPVHLPACYFVGELLRGRNPTVVVRHAWQKPSDLVSGDAAISLYLGAIVLGIVLGAIGYALIQKFWPEEFFAARRFRRRGPSPPPVETDQPASNRNPRDST